MNPKNTRAAGVLFLFLGLCWVCIPVHASVPKLTFDHNYTFKEVATYLNAVADAYPKIDRLHPIGKSFQGKDLLVMEITNEDTGIGLRKPGFWIDGNLHAGEVMGAAVCLKTIEILVTGYGQDPSLTDLIDTRVIYVMPKLNPDGSDHYLTRPDGMRSSVRPHDSDGDGIEDEDPGEDLDGDGYITSMRLKSPWGNMKDSAEDPRLMVRREEGESGSGWYTVRGSITTETGASTKTASEASTSTATGRRGGSRNTSSAGRGATRCPSPRPGRWRNSFSPIPMSPASSIITWRETSSTVRPPTAGSIL